MFRVFAVLAVFLYTSQASADEVYAVGFRFNQSKIMIRFGIESDGKSKIAVYDAATGKSTEIYSGKLKEVGVNGTSIESPFVKVVEQRALTFTYAITEDDQMLLISDKGQIISHPKLPRDINYCKMKSLEWEGRNYSVVSIVASKEAATYFFDHSGKNLIKIAPRSLSDKEMEDTVIDDELRSFYAGAVHREIDMDHLEMESLFEPRIPKDVLNKEGGKVRPLELIQGILTDMRDANPDKGVEFTAKDNETIGKIVEGFRRKDARSIVLLGQSGTGKTTLIEGVLDQIPKTWRVLMVPREALEQGGSYVGEIGKRISAMIQAAKMEPIIYVFDEFHSLKGLGTHAGSSVDIIQQLKKYIASGELMIIATDTPEEYQRAFGSDPALKRRFTEIRVDEPRGEELQRKLESWLKAKTKIGLDAQLLTRLAAVASDFDPGSHEPARSVRLLEQLVTDLDRQKRMDVLPKDIDKAAWNLYQVGPHDPLTFIKDNEDKRQKMLERIVDQPQLVDATVDLWREVNLGVSPKKHRSILVVGPTGAGKTYSGQSFAKVVLDDPERFLEVDATKYQNGNFDSLIGTARYHAESPQGILPEFLGGRGRGRNVIVINEIEKAHPDLIKILMEMLDTGKLQAGDGRTYYLGRSLVIFTSNRGADEVYPVGAGPALKREELMKRLTTFTDKRVRDLFLKPSSKNLYDTSQMWGSAELQRIDRAVAVAPPSFEGAVSIVESHARQIGMGLLAQHFYTLSIDRKIAEEIVTNYYVPEEGVRSLLQRTENLINALHQEAVLKFQPKAGESIEVNWDHREATGETDVKVSIKPGDRSTIVQTSIKKLGDASPLLDPTSLSRLTSLEAELAKRVFGQTDALKMVARSVRTRALNPQLKVPGHALLLGSTGNGKTETGRALADILFGSSKRMKTFSFGNVKSDHDWSNIFGSARGLVGSDTMCPFEKALHDFPEGMVLIFDEIGNMGADPSDPRSGIASPREELLQRLYDMFEEGTWTSPLGKTYDLRKHFILMTSNEGQEFFAKLPNDDLRMAEWKRTNRRDFLQQLLLKHGWPEALLGRIGNNIALMKPLLRSEQILVAQKEVEKVIEELKSAYEFEGINVAHGFYDRLAESFFSHERGARSLREVAQAAVVDLIGQALIEHSFEREKLKDATFTLDVSDTFAGRLRRNAKDLSEREVSLKLSVQFPGRELQIYDSNVTRDAKPKRLSSYHDSEVTAYHEAGHAVANDFQKTGDIVEFITIRGEGGYGGYVRYKAENPPSAYSREGIVARIARILAGQLAQEMAGYPKDSGWQSDIEQARKIAELAVSTWGLTDEALKLPVKDGKVILSHKTVQTEIAKLVEEGRMECDRVLRERWISVRLVAIRLMERGHMERVELEAVINESEAMSDDKVAELRERFAKKNFVPKRWKCIQLMGAIAGR